MVFNFVWTHVSCFLSFSDVTFVFLQLWLSLFIMTKRDSVAANLPSLRDLRMAFASDFDTPMESISEYSSTAHILLSQYQKTHLPFHIHNLQHVLNCNPINILNAQFTLPLSRSSSTAAKLLN